MRYETLKEIMKNFNNIKRIESKIDKNKIRLKIYIKEKIEINKNIILKLKKKIDSYENKNLYSIKFIFI